MAGADSGGARQSAPQTPEAFREAVAEAVDRARRVAEAGPYDPEWESLSTREPAPEWFRDAKLGIYCHWGIYSVPAYETEWYPRWMYMTDPAQTDADWGGDVYPHHVETYGDPDEVPYQAFVPEFSAAQFDPGEWADLFADAGAQFAGVVAEHHDGWSNWASALNPWNAGDRGPRRDLVGDLATALRDRGLRVLTSFHHARTREHYQFAADNFPSVTEGYPERVLYGAIDESLFFDLWLAKLVEVIDRHEPDAIYHDGTLPTIPEWHRRRYLAYYFNRAAESDRDVVVTAKDRELPLSVAVEDFERGRPAECLDRPWLADTSLLGSTWGYARDATVREVESLVHELVDIVSKNGRLLLNVAPRADGTIPADQRAVLRGIGDWLDTHGEAIYGTRPWTTFGEGPTRLEEGGWFLDAVEYTAEDVRYTQRGAEDTLYAIVLGWPDRDVLTLEAVDVADARGGRVELLGHDGALPCAVTDDGLAIEVPAVAPADRPSEHAVAFALSGFGLDFR